MPSFVVTLATSSTASCIVRCIATARSRPWSPPSSRSSWAAGRTANHRFVRWRRTRRTPPRRSRCASVGSIWLQVVGSPQPGVAGADDGHIGGDVTRQLRRVGEAVIGRKRIEPEGNTAGIGHRRDTTQSASATPYAGADVADPDRLVPRSVERHGGSLLGRSGVDRVMSRCRCRRRSRIRRCRSAPRGVPSSRCWYR